MLILPVIAQLAVAFVHPAVLLRPISAVPDSTLSTWTIDVPHSALTFSARHLLVEHVPGKFTEWTGTIRADPEHWNTASVSVTVQAASLTTGFDMRDDHLRGSDFFDVEKFPTITFVSTKVVRHGDSITVVGNLTMHGVTKPLTLMGKMTEMKRMPTGKYLAAFTATTTVDRFDYDIKWNDLDGLVPLVGKDVTIDLNVVAKQQ